MQIGTVPSDSTFDKARRIRNRRQFLELQSRGRRLHSTQSQCVVILSPSPTGTSRLGITISRKAEPRATRRNYFKRVVRELFRKHGHLLLPAVDLLIIAKVPSSTLNKGSKKTQIPREDSPFKFNELTRSILKTLEQHGYLPR